MIITEKIGASQMNFPSDRRYSEEHEWVVVEGNQAIIGITEFAQDQLGEVVYVDLPEVGATYSAGDSFGEVESVKSVSELFLPVSGEVVEINDALDAQPETINADPYDAGWMIKIELSDPSELDNLMDAAAYETSIG